MNTTDHMPSTSGGPPSDPRVLLTTIAAELPHQTSS